MERQSTEMHLFIIWKNALEEKDRIIEDIRSSFILRNLLMISWSEEFFSLNLSRFYGTSLPDGSFKESHCGRGDFLLIVVEDKNPVYEHRMTSHGDDIVNINLFEKKELYRSWTGGGHKIHATNSEREFNHDITLLLGKNKDDFKDAYKPNKEIEYLNMDLIGSRKWLKIEDIFYTLNSCINYVVLRDFENDMMELQNPSYDADILCENLRDAEWILNAKEEKINGVARYKVNLLDKYCYFDIKYIGDGYYCDEMEGDILKTREYNNFYYIPNREYWYMSSLYHALVHKFNFETEYNKRLEYIFGKETHNSSKEKQFFIDKCNKWLLDKNYRIVRYLNNPQNYNIDNIKLFDEETYIDKCLLDDECYVDYKLFEPKPILNLQWYKKGEVYYKGTIDDNVINIIASNEPEEYVDAMYTNYNNYTFSCLAHSRQNILNWYPFEKETEILEIGSGMGEITGMLCDKAKKVTSIVESKKKAIATLIRCREKENLEIIVGDIKDIQIEKKFDYVVALGELEYQEKYSESEDPFSDYLVKIKSFLKPTGSAIIGTENRYKLKNWINNVIEEDCLTDELSRKNGFSLPEKRCFTKKELERMIKQAGFDKIKFYFPMPDYRFPSMIFSDKCNPSVTDSKNIQQDCLLNQRITDEREKELWKDISENGVFEFFASSFLVDCSMIDRQEEVTFSSINSERFPEYRLGTRIIGKSRVEKYILGPKSSAHLDTILMNEDELRAKGLNVLLGKRIDDKLVYEYCNENLLDNKAICLLNNKQASKFEDLLLTVYQEILKSSEIVDGKENIIFSFGLEVPFDEKLYGPILKKAYLDMILRNAFDTKNGILWFDQEWTLENAPASFVMFRLMRYFLMSYPTSYNKDAIRQAALKFGFLDLWDVYSQIDELFVGAVNDNNFVREGLVFYSSESR